MQKLFGILTALELTISALPIAISGQTITIPLHDIGSGLTFPSGDFRWRDVADQLYSSNYSETYNYTQSATQVSYNATGDTFRGVLTAVNLKPNFAYQVKLVSFPGAPAGERIGLVGRWWQEEWSGSAWTNGLNLNNKGAGTSPSPNDSMYFYRRDIPDPTSPTGLHFRYTGYLVYYYFITDESGNALVSFEVNSSYHVLWKTSQRVRTANDGPQLTVTFDADLSGAYDDTGGDDYAPQSVSVFGEWERLPVPGINLAPGDYAVQMILTEESFHGSGGSSAGGWAAAMGTDLEFHIFDSDSDGDGIGDDTDNCVYVPNPFQIDSDGDSAGDACDICAGHNDYVDNDDDGVPDGCDGCVNDPNKTDPGVCGCDVSDTDSDGDAVPDCIDICPDHDDAVDSDGDSTPDSCDGCPDDPYKTESKECGCGVPDTDADIDGVPDCRDVCPGYADTVDADSDGVPDGCDECPDDPDKSEPRDCGCGAIDTDSDGDQVADCNDLCPNHDDSVDSDGDSVPDGCDICATGDDNVDSDSDGVPNGCDGCPDDRNKIEPATCGCGMADSDTDGDGIANCIDNCPDIANVGQEDINHNEIGDACEPCCGFWTAGITGNVDCSGDGNRNLSDITRLIDRVYISRQILCCEENGNIDGDPENKINLADITALIDHVYISKTETAACE